METSSSSANHREKVVNATGTASSIITDEEDSVENHKFGTTVSGSSDGPEEEFIPSFFTRNQSTDASIREDAQITTIHGLMKRIEKLEQDKAVLKEKLEGKHIV
jgi:hypothetical protein